MSSTQILLVIARPKLNIHGIMSMQITVTYIADTKFDMPYIKSKKIKKKLKLLKNTYYTCYLYSIPT